MRSTRALRAMHTPYPFDRLPTLTRAQLRALSELSSLCSEVALDAALTCAGSMLGTPLSCVLGLPTPYSDAELTARATGRRAVWVELEPAAARPEPCVWLELPLGLCEYLVDRVLGGTGPLDPTCSLDELDEFALGALAYLVARVCAAVDSRLALRSLGTDAPPTWTRAAREALVSCAVALRSGQAHATFQLYVPARVLRDARAKRPAQRRFAALPLALWADAGSVRLDLATLRSLGRGDVVVLDRSRLDAAFRGEVIVRVEGSRSALHCRAHDDRLEVETIACTPEPTMTSGRRIAEDSVNIPDRRAELAGGNIPDRRAELAGGNIPDRRAELARGNIPDRRAELAGGAHQSELARDAPIELSLEVARFQLSLGELERLQPGDVLTTGRRIGEHVTLRAAGQAIAEGELVDVEGELGVRISRLLVK